MMLYTDTLVVALSFLEPKETLIVRQVSRDFDHAFKILRDIQTIKIADNLYMTKRHNNDITPGYLSGNNHYIKIKNKNKKIFIGPGNVLLPIHNIRQGHTFHEQPDTVFMIGTKDLITIKGNDILIAHINESSFGYTSNLELRSWTSNDDIKFLDSHNVIRVPGSFCGGYPGNDGEIKYMYVSNCLVLTITEEDAYLQYYY